MLINLEPSLRIATSPLAMMGIAAFSGEHPNAAIGGSVAKKTGSLLHGRSIVEREPQSSATSLLHSHTIHSILTLSHPGIWHFIWPRTPGLRPLLTRVSTHQALSSRTARSAVLPSTPVVDRAPPSSLPVSASFDTIYLHICSDHITLSSTCLC